MIELWQADSQAAIRVAVDFVGSGEFHGFGRLENGSQRLLHLRNHQAGQDAGSGRQLAGATHQHDDLRARPSQASPYPHLLRGRHGEFG